MKEDESRSEDMLEQNTTLSNNIKNRLHVSAAQKWSIHDDLCYLAGGLLSFASGGCVFCMCLFGFIPRYDPADIC